ncbi:hypothetical protein CRM22_001980 [Opisthorchis felineus]|uniref:Uncharacterized protein n=1 Tax=Opisthorchis felineus TaxID=147828 RepID=A0A4S2M858_OPIFE|nr:hypothetical protein CRM22_001980 [Opisthorchis felineus]
MPKLCLLVFVVLALILTEVTADKHDKVYGRAIRRPEAHNSYDYPHRWRRMRPKTKARRGQLDDGRYWL